MVQATFFVHNWRTLILSLVVIRRFKWSTFDIKFLTARGFHSLVENFGYQSFNLDRFFGIPYSYHNRRERSWQPVRELALLLRAYSGCTELLFLPHTRDPMMQLVLSSIRPCQLMFIEEGCLFPRRQIANSLSKLGWHDLVASYIHDEHHFFSVPPFLKDCLPRAARYYSSLDNSDITGIELSLVSDDEIRDFLKSPLFTDLQGSNLCKDSIVLIGTKDDSVEGVLVRLVNHARRLSIRYKKHLCYHPHPSLKLTCMTYLNQMSDLLGFYISDIECIDGALFCHESMILCGDASTITVTARRLGHKYYLLTNSVQGLIPHRVHQEELSVQQMLHKKF